MRLVTIAVIDLFDLHDDFGAICAYRNVMNMGLVPVKADKYALIRVSESVNPDIHVPDGGFVGYAAIYGDGKGDDLSSMEVRGIYFKEGYKECGYAYSKHVNVLLISHIVEVLMEKGASINLTTHLDPDSVEDMCRTNKLYPKEIVYTAPGAILARISTDYWDGTMPYDTKIIRTIDRQWIRETAIDIITIYVIGTESETMYVYKIVDDNVREVCMTLEGIYRLPKEHHDATWMDLEHMLEENQCPRLTNICITAADYIFVYSYFARNICECLSSEERMGLSPVMLEVRTDECMHDMSFIPSPFSISSISYDKVPSSKTDVSMIHGRALDKMFPTMYGTDECLIIKNCMTRIEGDLNASK